MKKIIIIVNASYVTIFSDTEMIEKRKKIIKPDWLMKTLELTSFRTSAVLELSL